MQATKSNQAGERTRTVFFALNRHTNTATLMEVSCFEELQMMFHVGIMLPNGDSANGIGRCKSAKDFATKAARGGTRII